MSSYSWPGNVRELENLIERIAILQGSGVITPHHLPEKLTQAFVNGPIPDVDILNSGLDFDDAVQAFEKQLRTKALERTHGVHDATGQALSGEVLRIDSREIAAAGVPPTELMARHVYYRLAFPLSQRPEFLTFTQTFGGHDAVLPAVMEFVPFQNRVPLPPQLFPTTRSEALAPENSCPLSVTPPQPPVQAAHGRATPCCNRLRRAAAACRGAASAAREQWQGENAV
jgi:hypothetical protein